MACWSWSILCATLLAGLTLLTGNPRSPTPLLTLFYLRTYFPLLSLSLVTHTVRITNLRVPHTYTLERDNEPDPLVLDCEYEIGAREKGFVLKWLFNNHSIYQWIPSVKGFAMVSHASQLGLSLPLPFPFPLHSHLILEGESQT